ncbi:hypothetical protein I5O09_08435 [Pseudomonas parafulva]|uniref:hypothetical protein n=1 Tax=Pseudomonas parafulva TaxID=157782 RepID=UPI0018D6F6FA|nr:hypothetical protein [Pseudomonas parafulva]MBH3343774.1 hypothetical protein [Pseudomonas parafulva]
MTMNLEVPCRVRNRTANGRRPGRGMQAMRTLGLLCGLFVLAGCDAAQPGASGTPTAAAAATALPGESRM